jgi:hypothetical protein
MVSKGFSVVASLFVVVVGSVLGLTLSSPSPATGLLHRDVRAVSAELVARQRGAQALEATTRSTVPRTSRSRGRAAPVYVLRTFAVDAFYTEPPENFDGVGCSGLSTTAPGCEESFRGDATFTGSMSGDAPFTCSSDLATEVSPDGKLHYICTDYVRGTLKGCGTGSFILEDANGYIDFSKYNSGTMSAPGYNTWTIRPGSASDALTHIVSGSGVNIWTEHVDGEAGLMKYAGTGHFTGTVTCLVPQR